LSYQTDELEIQKIGRFSKFLGLRVSALVEILLFFIVMLLISWFWKGQQNFFFISPHPYWIIVILISAQYGTKEGLVATVVATIIFFLGYLPEQTVLQDRFEYFLYIAKNPLLWFIAAVILGELRLRQIRERDRLKKVALSAAQKEREITTAYEGLQKHKNRLEVHLASDMNTALSAYQTFQKLETLDQKEILRGGLDLMRLLIDPEKYSVYLLEDNQLKMMACEGWEGGEDSPTTLDAKHLLFQNIVVQRRVVSILNETDRSILLQMGMLAAPICTSETKEVFGMVKIEQLSFLKFRMSSLESIRLIGEWVGTSYANYLAKQESDNHCYLSKQSQLYSVQFFLQQKEFLIHVAERLKIDLTLLTISLANSDAYPEEKQTEIYKLFHRVIKETLRSVDQAFECSTKGVECALLLINTSLANAQIVRQKISTQLEKQLDPQVHFTYRISPLYVR
jgi:polysaccharide biosynthesis protein PelD